VVVDLFYFILATVGSALLDFGSIWLEVVSMGVAGDVVVRITRSKGAVALFAAWHGGFDPPGPHQSVGRATMMVVLVQGAPCRGKLYIVYGTCASPDRETIPRRSHVG